MKFATIIGDNVQLIKSEITKQHDIRSKIKIIPFEQLIYNNIILTIDSTKTIELSYFIAISKLLNKIIRNQFIDKLLIFVVNLDVLNLTSTRFIEQFLQLNKFKNLNFIIVPVKLDHPSTSTSQCRLFRFRKHRQVNYDVSQGISWLLV